LMIQAWESGGASEQRGEEVEPDPEPGLQYIVGCSFPEFVDQHFLLARRCKPNWMRRGVGVKATMRTVSLAPLGRFLATVMTIPL
jgi:hypothetical protein